MLFYEAKIQKNVNHGKVCKITRGYYVGLYYMYSKKR